MSNDSKIQNLLKSRSANYVSSFRVNELSDVVFIEIPTNLIKEKVERGFTSKNQISRLRRFLEKESGLRVFVTTRTPQDLNDLEVGLRALLTRKFSNTVDDLFTSFSAGPKVFVWIALKNLHNQSLLDEIKSDTTRYLSSAKLDIEGIEFVTPNQPEPSIAAILRSVKITAPARVSEIIADLANKGLKCPSERWLSTKLDSARKRGWMIRNANGSYVLTAQGVALVPVSRSKTSSDIERILLLARRKRW